MPLPVLRSKLVSERIRVEFDFTSQLALGETIADPVVEVQVATGIDPAPEDMIASRKFLDGAKIFQWIVGGLPGVIYNLICTVQGSTGKPYKLERKLAVVPAVSLRPPLFGISLSTTIYPVNALESFQTFGDVLSGQIFDSVLDDVTTFGSVISGELRSIFVEYVGPAEDITTFGNITSGSLVTPLVTYTGPFESITTLGIAVSGTLNTILIVYSNYPPENLTTFGNLTGGSLT
jgi:hypothetical protein